jgi:hypothetical protein
MKNDDKTLDKILISFDIDDIPTFINILKTFSKIVTEIPWIFDAENGIIIQCVADNKTSYATLTIEKKNISNFIFNHDKNKYYININFEILLNLLNFAIGSDKINFNILKKNQNILNIKIFKNNINTKILKLNLTIIDNIKTFNKIIDFDYRITCYDSLKFNKYLKDMEKISPYISFLCSDNNFIIDCIGDNNSQVTINYSNSNDNSNDDNDTLKITKLNNSLSSPFKNYFQISDINQYSNCASCSPNIRLYLKHNEILKVLYQIYNSDKSKKNKNYDLNSDSDSESNLKKFATLRVLITNIDPENFKNNDSTNSDDSELSEYSDND